MEKWLKIGNSGEIESGAFRLIGACTKRGDDSMIGYFGSGLKYAMAVLLREGIEFKIFSGLQEVRVETCKETFRGQEFDVIVLDGEKTNFTTEMGIKWLLWQAIREIYCNAIDEPEVICEQVEEICGTANETAFFIKIDEKLEAIMNRWDRFFSFERSVHYKDEDYGEIFHPYGSKACIYRKGIRCWDTDKESLFDYNFYDININEARIISSEFYLRWKLAKMWTKPSELMFTKLIDACKLNEPENYLEWHIDWTMMTPSDVWLKHLAPYVLIPYEHAGHYEKFTRGKLCVKLPRALIDKLVKTFGQEVKTPMTMNDYKFTVVPLTKRDKYLLDEALNFFKEVKIEIKYAIQIAVFENKDTLGMAIKDNIIISKRVMDMGKKQIVATIIEEHFHLDSQSSDESRDFQDYLIMQMITALENVYGIFL